MKKNIFNFILLLVLSFFFTQDYKLLAANSGYEPQKIDKVDAVSGFVSRSGTQLILDGEPFRFSGTNVYWLGLDENVDGVNYPTSYRVDDVLDTVLEMGGNVVRTSAAKSIGCSKCIQPSLGIFNETALVKLDYVIKAASERGIRLILPLVDGHNYYGGGVATYTKWRGLPASSFYTDEIVIEDFKKFINHILNRINTYTGIAYKDDPTILAWETGNELKSTPEWTQIIADYIKSIDPNHLVADGKFGIYPKHLALKNVDMYSNHFYPLSLRELTHSIRLAQGADKVFFVGEYAWNEKCTRCPAPRKDNLNEFLLTIRDGPTAGDLFWSLFGHNDSYGYVQHRDGFTLHYPGENGPHPGTWDMRTRAQILRAHAYSMRGMSVPDHIIPKAPLITDITENMIAWRGVAGADTYTIERSSSGLTGSWTVICDRCATDNDTPWTDLTMPEGTKWYRVKAHNLSGAAGNYSPVFIKAPESHPTPVGEVNDWSKIYSHTPNLTFTTTSESEFTLH